MKKLIYTLLAILVFLAIASGIAKIMLLEQEVATFSEYGFSNTLLMAFGIAQLLGGLLLIFPGSRLAGMVIVALTFIVSALVLFLSNNIIMACITIFVVLALAVVTKKSLNANF